MKWNKKQKMKIIMTIDELKKSSKKCSIFFEKEIVDAWANIGICWFPLKSDRLLSETHHLLSFNGKHYSTFPVETEIQFYISS